MNCKSYCLSLIIIILSSKAKIFFVFGKMVFKMRLESALCSSVHIASTNRKWDVELIKSVVG